MITWKLWWLLVSYLIWHLTTQTINKSKTKIWPNPLPGWSTLDHIPDHIFLIIHFVCRHFCGPDFTIPISRRNPFSFQKLSPFTYHCFCSNIYMLNFHKMNSYQGKWPFIKGIPIPCQFANSYILGKPNLHTVFLALTGTKG